MVIVLDWSTLPKYQLYVLPFPTTLLETKGFDLLKEWHWPKAPFIAAYFEQYAIKTASVSQTTWLLYSLSILMFGKI